MTYPELGLYIDMVWFAINREEPDIEEQFQTMQMLRLVKKAVLARTVGTTAHAIKVGSRDRGQFLHSWPMCRL